MDIMNLSDKDLVDGLIRDAARVGTERSGLMFTAGDTWPDMDAKKKELMRRLEAAASKGPR